MKNLTRWALVATILLSHACGSSGSGPSSSSDPSGDWALALLVIAGTGDGAGTVDSARLFDATIQVSTMGANSYEVLLAEIGGASSTLAASVDGDELRLTGTLAWESSGLSGIATVLSSTVEIRAEILYGEVEVELSGGAVGSQTWFLSAFDPSSTSIPAIGWWRLEQDVVAASGADAASLGDSIETILYVGPHEAFKFVVAWWRSDGIRGLVTQSQGSSAFNLSGWTREFNDGVLTWIETVDTFQVDVEGSSMLERQITLTSTGDRVGEQISLYTGTRVAPGTALNPPSGAWVDRFLPGSPGVRGQQD